MLSSLSIEEKLAHFILWFAVWGNVGWTFKWANYIIKLCTANRTWKINCITNIAPTALQRAATPWRQTITQPLGGTEVSCNLPLEGSLRWAYSFIPWASSVPPNFMLDCFWPPIANSMLPLCRTIGTGSASRLLPQGGYRRHAQCCKFLFQKYIDQWRTAVILFSHECQVLLTLSALLLEWIW